ncbi:hypothetical protein [Silvibacterium sp.]|uniref:hypothetical protein n=1 Tax=Silvibacterium sp. TaxID=1964179 RepID=UPI0039E3EA53
MKRQRRDEVIDWEALENAPNTHGAFSFLKPLGTLIDIQEIRSTLLHDKNKSFSPERKTSPVASSLSPNADAAASITSTVDVLIADRIYEAEPLLDAKAPPEKVKSRPYKIHRCVRVEQGHSHGEHQLYLALWRVANEETENSRLVTIGWDRMGQRAAMSNKAAKRNLKSLIKKLAVEILIAENSNLRIGRTYRLYSFKEILRRRKNAGLIDVVKDKGVRFVNAAEAAALISATGIKQDYITSTVDISPPETEGKTSTVTVDIPSPGTGDKTSPLLRKYEEEIEGTTTRKPQADEILGALAKYVVADEKAALHIYRDCRKVCADVTPEEVVKVVHLKAPAILRDRSIWNPLALLIRAVPQCFSGAGANELRAQWALEKEYEQLRELERQRQDAEIQRYLDGERSKLQEVLKDTRSSEADRVRAERELMRLREYEPPSRAPEDL